MSTRKSSRLRRLSSKAKQSPLSSWFSRMLCPALDPLTAALLDADEWMEAHDVASPTGGIAPQWVDEELLRNPLDIGEYMDCMPDGADLMDCEAD